MQTKNNDLKYNLYGMRTVDRNQTIETNLIIMPDGNYMRAKTIEEIVKSTLDNYYLNERKAENDGQPFTIENIRRINQKMIDEHKANKNHSRILQKKELFSIEQGNVLKAIDRTGNAIIFDWDYIGLLSGALHFKKDF